MSIGSPLHSSLPCDGRHLCSRLHLFFTPIALFIPVFVFVFWLLSFFLIYFFRENLHFFFQRYIFHRMAPPPEPSLPFKIHQQLDPTILESFPVFVYENVGKEEVGSGCAVCLLEFAEGNDIRLLAVCCHAFHRSCIDRWLVENATCPVCRSDLTAPPDVAAVVAANEVLDNHAVTIKQRMDTVESLLEWKEPNSLQSNEDERERR